MTRPTHFSAQSAAQMLSVVLSLSSLFLHASATSLLDTDVYRHPHNLDNLQPLADYNTTRDERLLFTLIRFKNGPCTGGGQSGTCYTERECTDAGGTNIGSCAYGFGVCCYKEITCGGTTSTNCTYLVSPGYPSTYSDAMTCSMTFTRMDNICQLRMDVEDFSSVQPDTAGRCQTDQFTVDGERKFTYLCGEKPSENWHFYLDVNGQSNPTTFNFLTGSGSTMGRKFKIKISMIECSQKIPSGCGQYYTGDTGTFQSFNYGSGNYLAGMDYSICTRKEKNKCKTTLTTNGPTFTACQGNDLYRIPVGETAATTTISGLNTGNLYCQLPVAGALASAGQVPSPLTSVSNGPFSIWYLTNIDANVNAHPNTGASGYYQTFTHNPC